MCRWEKYQSEEEAALGRGKRVRKAVTYGEAFAPQPADTLNQVTLEFRKFSILFCSKFSLTFLCLQNSADEKREPEPEREYTPVGKALKIKL